MGDTSIATDLRAGIEEIVAELGKTCTLRRNEGTVPVDQNKDWLGKQAINQDYAAEVLIEDYTHREVDGSTIQTGDKKALVSLNDLAITPKTTDQFFDIYPVPDPPVGKWEIVSVKLPEVAGVALSAELQLRH